jgi:methylenetetrahydrofolate reductase (NADPH)
MNLAQSSRMVLEELDLLPDVESPLQKPLPWRPSLGLKRREENVRPIFWRNRNRSYIARTQEWDEFPNGRWGDARSPAFGEFDAYGIGLKGSNEQNISNIFVKYMSGNLESLPWSESAISKEADTLQQNLIDLNRRGFFTINSQPPVNGAKSNHPVYGWGPAHGYVYQKGYLEVLVSPEYIAELITRIERDPEITYYAVNKDGDLKTNSPDGPNAVTWGVFPGKEIVQPTIVEAVSFLAWKDEFYRLGQQWANCHASTSPSRYVIEDVMDTWYLINIVHNNFQEENGLFPLFDGLEVADMERELHSTGITNGDSTNGDSPADDSHTNGRRSTLDDLVEAAKSAASTVANGITA